MASAFYEEINDAAHRECMTGLNDFFDHHSLEESRNILWKWLNVSGSGQFHQLSGNEREALLSFYSHLQGLLETTHHIKTILDEQERVDNRK